MPGLEPRATVTAHLKYASYVARHKWFVFRAGRITGAPLWRLVIHDWSKLTPAEWGPMVRRFGGGRSDKSADPQDFHRAWTHHWHKNAHHWEHWLTAEGRPMDMPEPLIREMVADWMGAGRAITGKWEAAEWYAKNCHKIKLAPQTRELAESLLVLGYDIEVGQHRAGHIAVCENWAEQQESTAPRHQGG